MKNIEDTHDCACDHGHAHDHEHGHDHALDPLTLKRRWLLSVLIVAGSLILLRPFIVGQLIVRVTSYSGNSSYHDAIRLCERIIALDKDNIKAWTSLGYAYMDESKPDLAIPVFEKVLSINPDDRGAASFELGKAYYAKGDLTRAIGYFERIRSGGARASAILEADILKYRHGTLGFRSLNSMQTLLGMLLDCYKKTGNAEKADEIQKEYDFYKSKHSNILF